MAPGEPALIGHLQIEDLTRWPQVLENVQNMLLAKHDIDHVTLQPEPISAACATPQRNMA